MTNHKNRSSRERLIVIYSNGPAVRLEAAPQAVPVTAPRIRPLPIPAALGRAYTADLDAHGRRVGAESDAAVWLRVTPTGHWRVVGLAEEVACRGCGDEWLACQLETVRCPRPATAQDIASALLDRTAVTL